MVHSHAQKHEPAYQAYYLGPRPDDKLPPFDHSQDGCIYLKPGELYCRWRHPITRGLCTNTQRFSDTISLVEHYRRQHGCKVAPACRLLLDERDEEYQEAIRWYSNLMRGRMPSMSPPTNEPSCQNASFDDAQTKVETTKQTPGELQPRSRGVPVQRQEHKASTIQPADSNGEERKLPELKIEDLPLRSNEVWDRSGATNLCTLFNQHQASMPSRVRLKLLHLLKTGQFKHNDQSICNPLKHQLSLQMYDENAAEPKWINATYERWFILVGIYGFAMLRNKASGLWKAIMMRYGERLDTELAFEKSRDETGSLLRPFLSQLGEEVSMWTPTIQQHGYMLRQHEQTIRTQSAMIQQLREANYNQQKQIDQLKAIVGVQVHTCPSENMAGRHNNINRDVGASNADIGSKRARTNNLKYPASELVTFRRKEGRQSKDSGLHLSRSSGNQKDHTMNIWPLSAFDSEINCRASDASTKMIPCYEMPVHEPQI